MAGPGTYSLRTIAEQSLSDLVQTHRRLSAGPGSGVEAPVYVFDTRLYLAPTPQHVNRQTLVQLLVRGEGEDPESLSLIYQLVLDEALIGDYYALAWAEAQQQALRALGSVWKASIGASPIRPAFDDGVVRLSRGGHVAAYVYSQLREAGADIRCCNGAADGLPWDRLRRVSQIVSAVEQAFKIAAASLMTFDMEECLAGLMRNEVVAACA
ncbi:MAG TPA: hypothetical protein VFA48_11885 [Gammaproteobacteria bacterium]|nr:hypothetical protein [Gammaproteobacteria bacterium]